MAKPTDKIKVVMTRDEWDVILEGLARDAVARELLEPHIEKINAALGNRKPSIAVQPDDPDYIAAQQRLTYRRLRD